MDKQVLKKEGFWKVEVEGQTDRVRRLMSKRDKVRQEFEHLRQQRARESEVGVKTINQQFETRISTSEQVFTDVTTGLVSREEYKERRELLEQIEEMQKKLQESTQEQPKKKSKVDYSTLSFANDDIEEEEEAKEVVEEEERKRQEHKKSPEVACNAILKENSPENESSGLGKSFSVGGARRKALGKDPSVDTSFLPDREREEEVARLKEAFGKEWMLEQEKIKKQTLDITYSYWDGKGNRRKIKVEKGWTISRFLSEVQREFRELARLPVENMIYIKEDLIIPQHLTFYDLIITKARGKSGPLFHFDVHDDVRLAQDIRKEKDESHSGKVVDRKWYERNRHIFPASRWEIYDPAKAYGTYTIKGSGKTQ